MINHFSLVLESVNGIFTIHSYTERADTIIFHISEMKYNKSVSIWMSFDEIRELGGALVSFANSHQKSDVNDKKERQNEAKTDSTDRN